MKKRFKKKNQKRYWENQHLKNELMRLFPREFRETAAQNQLQLELLQKDMGDLRLRLRNDEMLLHGQHRRMERLEKRVSWKLDSIKRWALGTAAMLVLWFIVIIFL